MSAQMDVIRATETATLRERAELLSWQTHAWAELMPSAMLVNLVRKVPLRARALSELRLDSWESTLDGQRAEVWTLRTSSMLRISGWAITTKGRDFIGPYIRPECVGDPDFEAFARRELLELFLRPHGARNFLLTQWRTDEVKSQHGRSESRRVATAVVESPYLLPSSATFGNCGRGTPRETRLLTGLRWQHASLSVHFESVVRAHTKQLKLNMVALNALHGAFRIHVERLLYGSHFVPQNLSDASLMLHHANIMITSQLYVGRSAAQAKLESTAGERRGRREADGHQAEMVATLHADLAVAEERAAAAELWATTQAIEHAELLAMLARLRRGEWRPSCNTVQLGNLRLLLSPTPPRRRRWHVPQRFSWPACG